MRFFIISVLSCLYMTAAGQSTPNRPSSKLVNAFDASVVGTGSTEGQSKSWKLEAESNPFNARAWLNCFLWTDRDKSLAEKQKLKRLEEVMESAAKYVANHATYSLMVYLYSGKKDTAALFKAARQKTESSIVYPYVIQYAVMTGLKKQVKEYAAELEKQDPLHPALAEYHHNVLMSADSNSTVYAQGLNDLVPMVIMQQVHRLRTDLQLKFLEKLPAGDDNVYICLSSGREAISSYREGHYSGLLIKTKGTLEIADMEKKIRKFKSVYLHEVKNLPQEIVQVYKNYIPSFLLVYRHLKATKSGEAETYKKYIESIAERTGVYSTVVKELEK